MSPLTRRLLQQKPCFQQVTLPTSGLLVIRDQCSRHKSDLPTYREGGPAMDKSYAVTCGLVAGDRGPCLILRAENPGSAAVLNAA